MRDFSLALLEGLAGGADFTKDGNLTVAELDLWLSERVKGLTERQQHAVVRRPDTVPDFAIAAVESVARLANLRDKNGNR